MREIPQHQRADFLGGGGDPSHVVDLASRVVDMGQHEDRDATVERRLDLGTLDGANDVVATEKVDQSVRDVEVGWEVRCLRQDEMPSRLDAERTREQLEKVYGGAVSDDHFARLGPAPARALVSDAGGRLHPVGRVPASDQAGAPFLPDHLVEAGERAPRAGGGGVCNEGGETL